MSNYRAQYKISQDAVRKYAEEVRELKNKIVIKNEVIKNLKKVVGEIDRSEGEKKILHFLKNN